MKEGLGVAARKATPAPSSVLELCRMPEQPQRALAPKTEHWLAMTGCEVNEPTNSWLRNVSELGADSIPHHEIKDMKEEVALWTLRI